MLLLVFSSLFFLSLGQEPSDTSVDPAVIEQLNSLCGNPSDCFQWKFNTCQCTCIEFTLLGTLNIATCKDITTNQDCLDTLTDYTQWECISSDTEMDSDATPIPIGDDTSNEEPTDKDHNHDFEEEDDERDEMFFVGLMALMILSCVCGCCICCKAFCYGKCRCSRNKKNHCKNNMNRQQQHGGYNQIEGVELEQI